MANLNYCFFCCEIISEKNYPLNKIDSVHEYLDNFDREINNSTSGKLIRENVVQISHYLNVPRILIDQESGALSKIKNCADCTKISGNLSDFCSQLEVIQMKIDYYLTKLNKKIRDNSADANGQKQNCLLSNFQKCVYQKCLEKVQNDKCSRTPEVRVTKLKKIPERCTQQFKLENIHQYPVVLEEVEDQIKIDTDAIISELPTSQDHNQEFEFQNNPNVTCSVPLHKPRNRRNKKPPNLRRQLKEKGTFICGNCGKCFSFQRNLRRHFREKKICGEFMGEETVNCVGNFECSNCHRRYSRRDLLKNHLKTLCKTGQVIDLGTGKKSIKPPHDTSMPKGKYKFAKCTYCGMLVMSKCLAKHVQNRHTSKSVLPFKRSDKFCKYCNIPIGKVSTYRTHLLAVHGGEMMASWFKCETCNKSYELKTSWNRHLRRSEKCRLAGNAGNTEKKSEVGNQEVIQNSTVLGLSFKEVDEDAVVIMNDVKLSIEDPLAI